MPDQVKCAVCGWALIAGTPEGAICQACAQEKPHVPVLAHSAAVSTRAEQPHTWIDPGHRDVSYTVTVQVAIGHRTCLCGKPSPDPTSDQLVAFAKLRPRGGTLWPGVDSDQFKPAGWSYDREEGDLCDECTEAKRVLFESRREGRKR